MDTSILLENVKGRQMEVDHTSCCWKWGMVN